MNRTVEQPKEKRDKRLKSFSKNNFRNYIMIHVNTHLFQALTYIVMLYYVVNVNRNR